MNEIVQRPNANGQIEAYCASEKLTDSITANFAERGRLAARLLVVTLTETPYTPTIGRVQYEVPVTNRYSGEGVEEGEELSVTDTVDEARIALAEFVSAPVPDADRLRLRRYKTRYTKMLDELTPSWRTDALYKNTFNESFVQSARSRGVNIPSPRVGELIIKGAPTTLQALSLEGHASGYLASRTQKHDAVTRDGRIVTVYTREKYSTNTIEHFLATNVELLNSDRGGRAPGSTIAHKIEERVVNLRSRSSKA